MFGISEDYLRCRSCGQWYARRRTIRRPVSALSRSEPLAHPCCLRCRHHLLRNDRKTWRCWSCRYDLQVRARGKVRAVRAIKRKPNRKACVLSRNPVCLKCRIRMKSAGTEKNRRCFRCGECGCRASYGIRKRTIAPAEHVASCFGCRRVLVTGGNARQYLRCLDCNYLVKREGVKEGRQQRGHMASCVGCRRPMWNNRDGQPFFYCPRCHWAASARCGRQPIVSDERLPAFVQTFVPRDLPQEIRQEVETEILLALLKTRRAGNGYGLTPKRMNAEIVRRFIKKAWRSRDYQYKHVPLDDGGEYPLIERLPG